MKTTAFSSVLHHEERSISDIWSSTTMAWAIIGIGILLRLLPYLSDRSLWWDEATIALDVLARPFNLLLQPSDVYDQTAPVGFLLMEKLAVSMFGNSEFAFRSFPFISGIVSLLLFYAVTSRMLKPTAVPFALILFAISGRLIYFSGELKQYSSEGATQEWGEVYFWGKRDWIE